jgi:WD40 repeat protein
MDEKIPNPDRFPIEDFYPPGYCELIRAARKNLGRFPARRLEGWVSGPTAIAFSPDSKIVASGGWGGIRLHDVQTGFQIGRLTWDGLLRGQVRAEEPLDEDGIKEYSHHVMCSVLFTPDGRMIVAGDGRGDVHTWNVDTGALHWSKDGKKPGAGGEGHGGSAFVAISPDGRLVASGGSDGYVRAWDVNTGTLVGESDLTTIASESFHSIKVCSLAYSPDGCWIACGMNGAITFIDPIVVVNTRDWTAHRVADFPVRRAYISVLESRESVYDEQDTISFSHDGRWLVATDCYGARVYDVQMSAARESDGKSGLWLANERRIGYQFINDRLREYESPPEAGGAAFLGDTSMVAILQDWSIVEIVDVAEKKKRHVFAIRAWDDPELEKNDDVIDEYYCYHRPQRLMAIAVSPDRHWLATGYSGGNSTRMIIVSLLTL